jgi:hypothetical protein
MHCFFHVTYCLPDSFVLVQMREYSFFIKAELYIYIYPLYIHILHCVHIFSIHSSIGGYLDPLIMLQWAWKYRCIFYAGFIFHNGYASVPFHQQCVRIPLSPHSHQQLLHNVFLIKANLIVLQWYLIVALVCINLLMLRNFHKAVVRFYVFFKEMSI